MRIENTRARASIIACCSSATQPSRTQPLQAIGKPVRTFDAKCLHADIIRGGGCNVNAFANVNS